MKKVGSKIGMAVAAAIMGSLLALPLSVSEAQQAPLDATNVYSRWTKVATDFYVIDFGKDRCYSPYPTGAAGSMSCKLREN